MRRPAISLLALLVSLAGRATAAGADKMPFEDVPVATREIVYKTAGDVELRLHVFEPVDREPGKPLPAIVFFFGGGWVGGSPKQFYPHCQYLATRGMVAMAAEYRVRSRHGTTPFECVADGKSAVRWIRANAKKLGVDPERIAAGGGSAGGHVAASTGTIEGHDEPGEDTTISSVPDALVLFNPVIDTTEKGYGASKLPGRETEISPAHHVRKGIPPTIIFHGTTDKTVPFENVERFTRLMKEADNECTLVPFEGKGHGFFNYGRDAEAFRETVRAADRFLAKHGFLSGKPTL